MQADIEIYLLSCPTARIIEWLNHQFENVRIETKGLHTQFWLYHGEIPIQGAIVEQAAGKKFSSVWFNSAVTPWENDIECARAAFAFLATEVRCNAQSWQESADDDPDLWWKINAHEEGHFIWR